MSLAKKDAPGRLGQMKPVAIVDIGSNSVRLVAYEGLSRSPTPIFNDKVLCGLGRGVTTTGRLPQDGVDRALAALNRFRVLCDAMHIKDVHVLATAAARESCPDGSAPPARRARRPSWPRWPPPCLL